MAPTIQYDLDISSDEHHPPAIANQSFPYNLIASDRRFEELLYSVIKLKIEKKSFNGFDQVGLMTGVRDKGRDCVLLKNGKNFGLVQCKKYNDNFSKTNFGEEIVKFALYSIVYPSLIHDKRNFIYFIAVSTGLALTCSEFIDSFNENIQNEPDLDKWIKKHKQIPSLSSLNLQKDYEIKQKVLEILTAIKVKKILPQDLDIYLSEPGASRICTLFFELKTVTDNSEIQKLRNDLPQLLNPKLDIIGITNELKIGSSGLSTEHNAFDELPDLHIPRSETQELFEWICSESKKDAKGKNLNMILLAGNAGMGKTVILKDLLDELTQNNIPVLALKVDKLAVTSTSELQQQIGLSIPIDDLLKQCVQQFEKVVLIIDQIDALSQSMSADRSSLKIFNSIIEKYLYNPNVRIVVSVRIHDLHYDPSLRVYRNIQSIVVDLLSDDNVKTVLAAVGIRIEEVPSKLLKLLSNPNHLNVFLRVAKKYAGWKGITSIQDLYLELWEQKVVNPVFTISNIKDIKGLLYKISDQMFKVNGISVSAHHFEDDIQALRYLESELLVKRENNRLQFFHQTFYDFIFAKSFVEKGGDFIAYIENNEQAIQIRAAIKMVISYMREYNPDEYLRILELLFEKKEIFFHIKSMLLAFVIFNDSPSIEEEQLLLKVIYEDSDLQIAALESATSAAWQLLILDNIVIPYLRESINIELTDVSSLKYSRYKRYLMLSYLYKCVNDNIENAWKYVTKTQNTEVLAGLVDSFTNWQDERAMEIFHKCETYLKTHNRRYVHVLKEIAITKPVFAWNKIRTQLLSEDYETKNSHNEYEERQLLKTLAKLIPEKMIADLFAITERNLDQRNYLYDRILPNQRQLEIDFADKDDLQGDEYYYRFLAVCLRRAAVKKSNEFDEFITVQQYSIQKGILRIVIFGLKTNEHIYTDNVYNLFFHLLKNEHIKLGGHFSYKFRELLQYAFPHMTRLQKEEIAQSLLKLKINREVTIHKPDKKHYLWGNWGEGRYAYLACLPQEFISNNPEIKKIIQEGERRYPPTKKYAPRGRPIMAGIVRPPLPAIAYQKMTEAQWIASFRKYTGEPDRFADDFLKGGLREHSWSFKQYVATMPEEAKFNIIRTAIEDLTISISYAVLGLYGLVEAGEDAIKILPLFKKLLSTRNYESELNLCISIAGYLIRHNTHEQQIVSFLLQNAIDIKFDERNGSGKEKDETSINGLVGFGINTIHGAAVNKLMYVTDKQYKQEIFETIEKILSNGPPESKAIILRKLAYLNRLDKERAFELFVITLNKEDNPHILASSIESLQYMSNIDFLRLVPIYDKLIQITNLGNEDMRFLAELLLLSMLFDKKGAKELLVGFIKTNTNIHEVLVRKIMKYFYINDDAPSKLVPLLMILLELPDEQKTKKLRFTFHGIEHINLMDIYRFIEIYLNSRYFTLTEDFIDYLSLQSGRHPLECKLLFNLAMTKELKDGDEDVYYFRMDIMSSISKFIVGVYNSIKGNDVISKTHRRELLQSFDDILKDYRYRLNTEKILDDLI